MPAFHAAWASGCRWIEADVQPTSDNVPMMLHDDDLARTTNGTGGIRSRSAREVRALDAGSWWNQRWNKRLDKGGCYDHTPVPLLSEVACALGPDRALLLEIKGEHSREQVKAELAVLAASGRDDRVFIESFDVQTLAHVRSIEPGRAVGLLVEELHDDPVRVCAELGAVAYNPRHELLRDRPTLVDELHGADIAVLAWTADRQRDWAFLTGIGVDGIITNTPAELLQWQCSPGRPADPPPAGPGC